MLLGAIALRLNSQSQHDPGQPKGLSPENVQKEACDKKAPRRGHACNHTRRQLPEHIWDFSRGTQLSFDCQEHEQETAKTKFNCGPQIDIVGSSGIAAKVLCR